MHRRKGCDESAPEITTQELQEERHSAMIKNGGIASNGVWYVSICWLVA